MIECVCTISDLRRFRECVCNCGKPLNQNKTMQNTDTNGGGNVYPLPYNGDNLETHDFYYLMAKDKIARGEDPRRALCKAIYCLIKEVRKYDQAEK